MADRDPADLSARLTDLATHPEAARWASHCAWVPGTGHCRNRPCSPECLFHEQRTAEAERIVQQRRRRRDARRPFAGRPARLIGDPPPR